MLKQFEPSLEFHKNEVQTLSTDIHVITAEINAYLRSGVYSFMEAGRRLKYAKETLIHGSFGQYAKENLCITASQASNLIGVYDQFGELPTSANLGLSKLFEMLALPSEVDRQQFIEQPHTIPSTGETKTVDEMTVRELREVKAELKKATEKAEQAETARQIADERAELAEQKAQQYEQLFGEQAMYDANTTKVTNGDAVTYAVYSFQEDVRGLVEKYSHLTHFRREFDEMIDEGREEYLKAVETAKQFIGSIERMLTEKDAIIIEQ